MTPYQALNALYVAGTWTTGTLSEKQQVNLWRIAELALAEGNPPDWHKGTLASLRQARIIAAGAALYFAAKWECIALPVETQIKMWTNLRDALELEEGSATQEGVGSDAGGDSVLDSEGVLSQKGTQEEVGYAMRVGKVFLTEKGKASLTPELVKELEEWLKSWTCVNNFKVHLVTSFDKGVAACREDLLKEEAWIPASFRMQDKITASLFAFNIAANEVVDNAFWTNMFQYGTDHLIVIDQ